MFELHEDDGTKRGIAHHTADNWLRAYYGYREGTDFYRRMQWTYPMLRVRVARGYIVFRGHRTVRKEVAS